MSSPSTTAADVRLKLFISYSRRDAFAADSIVDGLSTRGFEVKIDRRHLEYGEKWQAELAEFIRLSDTVIWLISEPSIRSKWVNWELDEVARRNKRLVPVMVGDTPRDMLPRQLGEIHILPAEGLFDITRDIDTLVRVLETDRAWLKEASRLSDRANEWFTKGRTTALLLRGAALVEAEHWKDRRPEKAPPPASDVVDLILASRQAATRRQRWWLGGSLAVAFGAMLLTVIALSQRNSAMATQSRLIAKLARESIDTGDSGTGVALTLNAMPSLVFNFDRPLVDDALDSLSNSVHQLRERNIFLGHKGDVNRLAITSDSESLVSTSDDGRIGLWSFESGTLNKLLPEHDGKVTTALISRDDHFLVTTASDNSLIVWDLKTQVPLYKKNDIKGKISSVSFSPSNHSLIISSEDGSVTVLALTDQVVVLADRHLTTVATFASFGYDDDHYYIGDADGKISKWRTANGAMIEEFRGHNGAITAVLETRNYLYSASFTGELKRWSMDGEAPPLDLTPHKEPVVFLRVNEDHGELVSASTDGYLHLYDATTGAQKIAIKAHDAPITALRVSPDSRHYLTTSRDGTAKLWEAMTGICRITFRGHQSEIYDAIFSPNGEKIVTASKDRTIRSWSVYGTSTTKRVMRLASGITSFATDSTDLLAAFGTAVGQVALIEKPSLRERGTFQVDSSAIASVHFSPLGKRVLMISSAGTIVVADTKDFAERFRMTRANSVIADAALSPDGEELILASVNGGIEIVRFNETPEALSRLIATDTPVVALDVSNRTGTIAYASIDGSVAHHELDSLKELGKHRQTWGGATAVSYSADGAEIIFSTEVGPLHVWNIHTGGLFRYYHGTDEIISRVTMRSDGKYLMCGTYQGNIYLFQVGRERPVAKYTGHLNKITGLRFDEDRDTVISTSLDGSIQWWKIYSDWKAIVRHANVVAPRCFELGAALDEGLNRPPLARCRLDRSESE